MNNELLDLLNTGTLKQLYKTLYCSAGVQETTKSIEHILCVRGIAPLFNNNGVLVKFIKLAQ